MKAWLTKILILILFLFAEISAALLTIHNVISFLDLIVLTFIIEAVGVYSVIRYPKRNNPIEKKYN